MNELRMKWSGIALACVVACGCFSSHGSKGSTSTETGNPPVLDAGRVALEVTAATVHISGDKGAVTPGGATIQITNLATGKVTTATAAQDGSFDANVGGSVNDTFVVRAQSGDKSSDAVYVVRGAAAVGEPSKLSCDARESLASALIDAALADADATCMQDADCALVERGGCSFTCDFGVASNAGEKELEVTRAAVDAGVCAGGSGCVRAQASCAQPPPVSCQSGKCVMGGTTGPSSCSARENTAGQQLASAINAADTHCLIDSDCTTTTAAVSCHDSCDPEQVFSKIGAMSIDAEVARINREVCGSFEADGCHFQVVPCTPPMTGVPVCRGGQCVRTNDPGGCTTCFVDSLRWGWNGGFVAYSDQSSITPCNHYRRARLNASGMAEQFACETDLVACNAITSTGAIMSALNAADVQAAFAKGPVLYGTDSRPVDGSVFRIQLGDKQIEVGGACNGASGCNEVPAGVQALAMLLQQVDDALANTPDCAAFAPAAPACPPDRKNATVCTMCGLGGGCAQSKTTCAKVCSSSDQCTGDSNGPICGPQGVCENAFCI